MNSVKYVLSQSWPTQIATNLMLGCWAATESLEFNVDTEELEDAKWFTKTEVKKMLDFSHHEMSRLLGIRPVTPFSQPVYKVPLPITTANKLLTFWVSS